ncbi:hypothetical protein AF335_04195 [Streptomyces eurocidicus]|uniref:Uncharacterized protein n=1 Tax=Streptomyces eurocidicus TaxID=66423 RepID=A0A2N8P3A0_STREU|nr:hypothetical protein AF335_04195 [Streptomyces eurocidicus]
MQKRVRATSRHRRRPCRVGPTAAVLVAVAATFLFCAFTMPGPVRAPEPVVVRIPVPALVSDPAPAPAAGPMSRLRGDFPHSGPPMSRHMMVGGVLVFLGVAVGALGLYQARRDD